MIDPHPRGNDASIAGMRLLIVEDEFIVARSFVDLLETYDIAEAQIAGSIESAIRLVDTRQFDAAILDVNLRGHSSEPVAAALREQGVPFLFVTGYGDREILPEIDRDRPLLQKPFESIALVRMLARLRAQGNGQSD